MKNACKRVFAHACAVLLVSSALPAETKCSLEVKLLLSPTTIQSAIASFSFEKEMTGRVYFYETDDLDLLKQGVIVRVRQGADNDLTVKVRVRKGSQQVDTSQLREHFPCEIDRTGAGDDIDYAVRREYKALQVPEMGADISSLLSPPQQRLLREARVSIDWARVKRFVRIQTTKWETTAQSPFRKLALELWESPAGNIVELSAKAQPVAEESSYAALRRLVTKRRLSLSASQDTKTSMVLQALAHHTSPPPSSPQQDRE